MHRCPNGLVSFAFANMYRKVAVLLSIILLLLLLLLELNYFRCLQMLSVRMLTTEVICICFDLLTAGVAFKSVAVITGSHCTYCR